MAEVIIFGVDEMRHPHLRWDILTGMCSSAFSFVSHGSSVAALEEGCALALGGKSQEVVLLCHHSSTAGPCEDTKVPGGELGP